MNNIEESRVDHRCHEFVYTGDCGHFGTGCFVLPADPVFIPVSSVNFNPGNEANAVNTEARARNDKCCADR